MKSWIKSSPHKERGSSSYYSKGCWILSARNRCHDLIMELCPHDIVRQTPRFHCELPAIELCFVLMKAYQRSHCAFSITSLRKTLPQSLDALYPDIVRRYFGRTRRFEAAHRLGIKTKDLNKFVNSCRTTTQTSATLNAERKFMQELGVDPDHQDLQGLCYCNKCTGKESLCKLKRCAVHGTNPGPEVPPRIPYLKKPPKGGDDDDDIDIDDEDDTEDRKDEDVYEMCRECGKSQLISTTRLADLHTQLKKFRCSVVERTCRQACGFCDLEDCACECDDCALAAGQCKCPCSVCEDRITTKPKADLTVADCMCTY